MGSCGSRERRRVVLPEPRKPVKIVMGVAAREPMAGKYRGGRAEFVWKGDWELSN